MTGVVVGLIATIVMDLVAWIRQRFFEIRPLDYALLGRWVLHLPSGNVTHHPIMASEPKRGEYLLGWVLHYGIGIALGWMFMWVVAPSLHPWPGLRLPLVFGIGTLVFPWLMMQPAFGFGVAANKTPDPARARLHSAIAHAAYGLGLWVGEIVVGPVLHLA